MIGLQNLAFMTKKTLAELSSIIMRALRTGFGRIIRYTNGDTRREMDTFAVYI